MMMGSQKLKVHHLGMRKDSQMSMARHWVTRKDSTVCTTFSVPCIIFPVPLFLTFLAKLFTHKSEEGFYRFCSKRQKFCSFARHTLTINTTPIPSIAMHISSLLDPFHVHFKFLSTPKYHYSQKCPEVHMERVQQ